MMFIRTNTWYKNITWWKSHQNGVCTDVLQRIHLHCWKHLVSFILLKKNNYRCDSWKRRSLSWWIHVKICEESHCIHCKKNWRPSLEIITRCLIIIVSETRFENHSGIKTKRRFQDKPQRLSLSSHSFLATASSLAFASMFIRGAQSSK